MRIDKFLWISLMGLCAFSAQGRGKEPIQKFPLENVRLLDGPFKHACDLDIEVLLQYDTDRLLAPFLKEAGLPAKAELFPNWSGLDGHVGGHYLSALSMAYASTGREECKARADYMVAELKRCQEANGDGYLGGIPGGKKVWDEVRAGNGRAVGKLWAPWYNLHKMYAGLRDAWLYTGNETARQMFLDFCDWGLTVIGPLDEKQMEAMLDTEFGGMNEVYVDAYEMSGKEEYLQAARRFSHRRLLDSMARGVDNLDNMHANTQVPKAVGYQRVAEATGDSAFAAAAGFFWETVVDNRSLAFGGNSRREHFPTAEGCREYVEEREGPETCNTYNMLKLTEGLFRMNPEARYADYYERAMFNHILSTQHPGHGGFVYFTPARPRHYRVYSSPNRAMWCCVGTGMENHVKYGEFVYSHTDDELYVNLFVASELEWKEKKLRLRQETRFPMEEQTRLTLSLGKPARFALKLRYPAWVESGQLAVAVNGEDYPLPSSAVPSSYVAIERKWRDGDVVEVRLPMHPYVEAMPNVSDYMAILYGPVLLAARTGTEDLKGLVAGEGRWDHIASGALLPIAEAPVIVGERGKIGQALQQALKPVEGKPLHFTCPSLFRPGQYATLELEPFAGVHDSRYVIYWPTTTPQQYEAMLEEQARAEREKLLLDKLTVDRVKPGEQQPEVDHRMETEASRSGYHRGESWRDAASGGYFSYNLLTGGKDSLSLRVRYWGAESGKRQFDILVDGKVLATENLTGKWNRQEFVEVEYPIPAEWLEGKTSVRVCFRPQEGNRAGGVFYLRLMEKKAQP